MRSHKSVLLALSAAISIGLAGSPDADAARVRIYDVPGGGTLVVPRTSITDGAQIVVRRRPGPRAPSGYLRAKTALSLSVRRGRLVGPVTLTVPFRKPASTGGLPLKNTVDLAYYDERARGWRRVPATVNPRRGTLTARLTHFSWWNPFSWDWGQLSLRLDQRIGELRGARTGPAHCTSGTPTPAWANVLVDNGADLPIRTCSEGQDGKVVIQITNNRPYGVILTYGAPVAWGWHERAEGAAGEVAAAFVDRLVSPNELYIPPLKAASVGVPQGGWSSASFEARVTPKSLAGDVMRILAEQVDLRGVRPQFFGRLAAECSSVLRPGLDGSVAVNGDAISWIEAISGCMLRGMPAAARAGGLDSMKIAHLERVGTMLRRVKLGAQVGYWTGYLADLYVGARVGVYGTFHVHRRVLGGSADGGTTPPLDGGAAPPLQPVRLAITGSCTTAGGTLTGQSSGFTPGGTVTIRAWYPDGRGYTNLISSARARSDGSIPWTWPCADDPAGRYSTEVVDNATGRGTGRVAFTIGVASPTPPPTYTLVVYNKVTNGATAMREDVPAYLSSVPQNFCRSNGCMVAGSERNTGGTYSPAVCQTQGARTTNGHDGSSTDDGNPGLFSSSRWYGIRIGDGRIAYISEVWIDPSQRGGLGLPGC